MIGAGSAVSPALALVLAAGQVLADVPEGYAATANFRDKGLDRGRRLLLSSSFFGFAVAAALVSFVFLRGAADPVKGAMLACVAGLLTLAAVEDIVEEAHASSEDTSGSLLAFVAGFALFHGCLGRALHARCGRQLDRQSQARGRARKPSPDSKTGKRAVANRVPITNTTAHGPFPCRPADPAARCRQRRRGGGARVGSLRRQPGARRTV